MMRKRRAWGCDPRGEILEVRCLLAGYAPSQIAGAYGLGSIRFTSPAGSTVVGDGTGQTIAVVELYHDPSIQASLDAFDSKYNLPSLTLTVNNLAGKQTSDAWSGEESLDVEWAHAMAPGAKILVVEAAPGSGDQDQFNNVLAAVRAGAGTPGVSVVSMSWGYDEFSGEGTYDSAFTAAGVTYIASAGDYGQVTWPSASPDVLSVGGTTLEISASGGYGAETGWTSTGGGLSTSEATPSFQGAVNSTSARSTPDVGFVADPATGVSIYVVPPGSPTGSGQWSAVGGTSVGAPAWAGLIAVVDQGRALAGEASLTGSTQTLPALYSLSSASFFKVPVTNPGSDSSTNAIINTLSHNTQVGLGSPAGQVLVSALVNTVILAPAPTPTPVPSPSPTSSPIRLHPPIPIALPVSTPTPTPIIPVAGPNPTPLPTPTASPTPPPVAPPVSTPPQVNHPVSRPKHRTRSTHPVTRHRPKPRLHRAAAIEAGASRRTSAVEAATVEDPDLAGPAELGTSG
jgi:subtilase family serine protease